MATILSLEHVAKYFGPINVVQDVCLEVEAGERHALIGPNGAGKSTLFNLITGRYALSGGRIAFNGNRIDRMSINAITNLGIARSFQITNIFDDMTVLANIKTAVAAQLGAAFRLTCFLWGMKSVSQKSQELLERIGLWEARDEIAGALAYGQQRALELGITLCLEPRLILLDEPTAGMTPDETRQIVALIKETTQDRTLLVIEHDLEVVFGLADRISVLHNGSILATNQPENIRGNQLVKEAYLGNAITT